MAHKHTYCRSLMHMRIPRALHSRTSTLTIDLTYIYTYVCIYMYIYIYILYTLTNTHPHTMAHKHTYFRSLMHMRIPRALHSRTSTPSRNHTPIRRLIHIPKTVGRISKLALRRCAFVLEVCVCRCSSE